MLLFETKLPFAYSCRSTQRDLIVTPYAGEGATTIPRGYDTTDITDINAKAAARVSQGSHTL